MERTNALETVDEEVSKNVLDLAPRSNVALMIFSVEVEPYRCPWMFSASKMYR